MQKIREKSLVIKSEGIIDLLERENGGKCGKGGEWYKDRGKCIKKSRIEFPDPMLMTLDTPHGPITKFLKKCHKNAGKMRGKIIFQPFWVLIQKLDHNSGLQAKNQREISNNKFRMLPWPFGWRKCDIRGSMV